MMSQRANRRVGLRYRCCTPEHSSVAQTWLWRRGCIAWSMHACLIRLEVLKSLPMIGRATCCEMAVEGLRHFEKNYATFENSFFICSRRCFGFVHTFPVLEI
jgi:hypothetical protein